MEQGHFRRNWYVGASFKPPYGKEKAQDVKEVIFKVITNRDSDSDLDTSVNFTLNWCIVMILLV